MKNVSIKIITVFVLSSIFACKKDTSNPLAVGKPYQGGIIAYIDASGQHGLIAASVDQGMAAWGCQGVVIGGADGTEIGTGAQNTKDILAGCNTAGIAAKICDDLVLGGYNDWYLPSQEELKQLLLNREVIGGFTANGGVYWSSTEDTDKFAIDIKYVSSSLPADDFTDKIGAFSVRAVRSF